MIGRHLSGGGKIPFYFGKCIDLTGKNTIEKKFDAQGQIIDGSSSSRLPGLEL